jgi:uracil-DNA glycosylase
MANKADEPQSDRLEQLLGAIRACRLCREEPCGAPLPHEPRPVLRVSRTARICICGQAPGTRVHASGTPFSDPSGDRLRQWMGVTPEAFYDVSRVAIVPMGFCFPGLDAKGADLPPRAECAPAWRARLFSLMPQFRLILLVGYHAQRWHLGDRAGPNLTETVARWRDYLEPCGEHATAHPAARVLPLPHPSWRNNAWLKRNPWFEAEVLPYLRGEVRRHLSDPEGGGADRD